MEGSYKEDVGLRIEVRAGKEGWDEKETNRQRVQKALMQTAYLKGLDGKVSDLKTFPPLAKSVTLW